MTNTFKYRRNSDRKRKYLRKRDRIDWYLEKVSVLNQGASKNLSGVDLARKVLVSDYFGRELGPSEEFKRVSAFFGSSLYDRLLSFICEGGRENSRTFLDSSVMMISPMDSILKHVLRCCDGKKILNLKKNYLLITTDFLTLLGSILLIFLFC
ncbi:MAG: hypothetical protein KKG60_03470 [Nanoarchaeota archaeon]|nr:hypothetical protein [Nanoarchaeota archaeon]